MMNTQGLRENIMNMFPARPPHASDYSENIAVKTLPLIGRVHLVKDINGIMQLSFIFAYWVYGTFSTLFIILLPQYYDGRVSLLVIYSFMAVCVMCLLSLIKASITNPGRIPLLSEDNNKMDTSDWVFCQTCNRKRPPRAHHCRRCRQCVLRMDHHCPWINNCVGEENHFAFLLLLLYAMSLSTYALTLTFFHFWVWPKCSNCDKEAFYIKHSIWFMYLLVVMALNMALVMTAQFSVQSFNLFSDRTTLENMQNAPHNPSRFRNWYVAYGELCGRTPMLCWLWPCRRRVARLDRIGASPV